MAKKSQAGTVVVVVVVTRGPTIQFDAQDFPSKKKCEPREGHFNREKNNVHRTGGSTMIIFRNENSTTTTTTPTATV
eukprot:9487322-Pyramimonas_sp.AAC.1